jgi:TrmH family RNA methyltransferase
MTLITSTTNSRIKEVRALAQRKQRQTTGLCVVEGLFHIGEAMEAGAITFLLHAPDQLISDFGRGIIAQAKANEIPVYTVTGDVMTSLADKERPQGLLAVARQRRDYLDNLSPATHPWLVALVAPQDPGNVGAILRTIDAVGASGLLLLDGGVDPYHPASIRASMGTIFRLPVVVAPFVAFASWARGHGYRLVGASAHGRTDYRAAEVYTLPLALLMGSEREGLSEEQTAECDELLRLPMHGRAGSLNLAVATGIFLYTTLENLAPGH